MSVHGPEAAVARTLEVLASVDLSDVPVSVCRELRLDVAVEGIHFRYTLRQGDHVVERVVEEPEAIAVWLETWLVPSQSESKNQRQQSHAAPRLGQTPGQDISQNSDSRPKHEEPEVPMQFTLRAIVDFDDRGPVWPGSELAFRLMLGRLWLGAAGSAAWAFREHESRNTQRLSVRLGQALSYHWGSWFFGGGVGIASARAQRNTVEMGTLRDEEARVFLEAMTGFDIALTQTFSLSLSAVMRGYIPDDFSAKDEDKNEPVPNGDLSIGFQVGLAWNL